MKSKIIFLLNFVLIGGLVLITAALYVQNHYYKEFTGFLLHEAADRIKAGESDRVRETLGAMGTRPSYGDLMDALKKLDPSRFPSKHGAR